MVHAIGKRRRYVLLDRDGTGRRDRARRPCLPPNESISTSELLLCKLRK